MKTDFWPKAAFVCLMGSLISIAFALFLITIFSGCERYERCPRAFVPDDDPGNGAGEASNCGDKTTSTSGEMSE